MYRTGYIGKIIRLARRIAYPERCAGCGRDMSATPDTYICDACRTSIPRSTFLICPVCKKRAVLGNRGGIGIHAACQKRAPYFLISLAWYGSPLIRKIVHSFKYRWFWRLREPLGKMLAQGIRSAAIPELQAYIVVPIPLHPTKLRIRGFNQAEELAKIVAAELGIPLGAGALTRTQFTNPQAKIRSWEKRKENIAGAFTAGSENIAGKRILLVDDITTSGTTLGEAARALKNAGARIVVAATIARS